MANKKEWTRSMQGTQLIAPGDVIQLMDGRSPVKCRVLSCLATPDGGCYANVQIVEGDRKGEKMSTKLRAGTEEGPFHK